MLRFSCRLLSATGLTIMACAPALAGGGLSGRPHPVLAGPPTSAQKAKLVQENKLAQGDLADARSTASPPAGEAGAAEVDDMQALITATREMARSTRSAADSIGMAPDRLTGILSRLDRIEAKVKHLDAPAQHPASVTSPTGWR